MGVPLLLSFTMDVRVDCWPIDGCPVRCSVFVVLEPVDVPLFHRWMSLWMFRGCPVIPQMDVPLDVLN